MRALRLPIGLCALALLASACQEYADPTLTPGQKKKVDLHRLKAAPKPQHVVNAIIEDQIKLIGYDLDRARVKPGDRVTITYYLEALSDRMADNKIFVHFQGKGGGQSAWMNLDHDPIEGLYPLRHFKKGEIIRDVQSFTVKQGFSGGPAQIYWGLWRGDDYRLKIKNPETVPHDKEGRVILATIEVQGAPDKPRAPLSNAVAAALAPGEGIIIDGKLDEAAWGRAQPTPRWTKPDGSQRAAFETTARFLWDQNYLYIAVNAVDPDIWTTFKDRDSNTWEQEVIEVFIDADGDQKDYLELQVTPANVIFDAKFTHHRSDLKVARVWNMNLISAVHIDGTLNQRDDMDKGYTVEMAIPIAEVPGAGGAGQAGANWRINLFRWDLPKHGRQEAAAFSPPIAPDFHALQRFGRLRFAPYK
ncbi:carbohydrate-binding family 9-like protein [Myxococcota bacterium]|nr:carbohydrate-binding family 9-like protein [Myxococcota bacterium]MBU1432077.1 carbohydrate-binding family 9-like protein [Myxococcota bacterium]